MQTNLERSDKRRLSREQTLDGVKQLVAEQVSLPVVQIREEQDLIADLGYDSLDVVELAMELEEHFDITVPDDMSDRAKTVGQVADGVMQLISLRS